MPRRALLFTALVLVTLGLVAIGAGTRPSEDAVALAVERAVRDDTGIVTYEVECATDLRLQVGPDPRGSGLPQVTVWGRPAVGRCTGRIADAEQGADRFVDGASSKVVAIDGPSLATRPAD